MKLQLLSGEITLSLPLDKVYPLRQGRREICLYCDDAEMLQILIKGIEQNSKYFIPTLTEAKEFLIKTGLPYEDKIAENTPLIL
jgi:hypothetical protein